MKYLRFYKYLKIVVSRASVDEINLYCDSCADQNHNKAVLAMIEYF